MKIERIKGFYMFLESERHRHQADIVHIEKLQEEIEEALELTFEEELELRCEAIKYVEIVSQPWWTEVDG